MNTNSREEIEEMDNGYVYERIRLGILSVKSKVPPITLSVVWTPHLSTSLLRG